MNTEHSLAQIRSLAAWMDPTTVNERIEALRRGGLPGSSIPNGSRSAEKPIPRLDTTDVNVTERESDFRKGLRDALNGLRQAETAQRWLCEAMDRTKANQILMDEAQGEHRFQCDTCTGVFKRTANQRPRAGRCSACYDFWAKEGRPEGDAGIMPAVLEARRERRMRREENVG